MLIGFVDFVMVMCGVDVVWVCLVDFVGKGIGVVIIDVVFECDFEIIGFVVGDYWFFVGVFGFGFGFVCVLVLIGKVKFVVMSSELGILVGGLVVCLVGSCL